MINAIAIACNFVKFSCWKIAVVIVFCASLLVTTVIYAEEGIRISSSDYFGCTSKEYFEKLVSYSAQADQKALLQGLLTGIALGECVFFEEGDEVFIVDTSLFSGLVKVRKHGSVLELWTVIEAVDI